MQGEPDVAALVERIAGRDADARLEALGELRRQLDALEADYVADAVRIGWSWSRIGRALGISRQAAHKKHAKGRRAAPSSGEDREVVVTSETWRAVRLAREEAAALGDDSVGTAHLLLGLVRSDEGPGGEVLRKLGVSLGGARRAVEPTVGIRLADVGSRPRERKQPSISPLARSVLERSLREALKRGDGHLSSEHLLLALLRDESGGAPRTLEAMGVSAARVRTELERYL